MNDYNNGEIRNCLNLDCPTVWSNLMGSAHNKRHCRTCNDDVISCKTVKQLVTAIADDRIVALHLSPVDLVQHKIPFGGVESDPECGIHKND